MKLLLTGGAGFIGTNLVYYWLKEHPEDDIVCFDALTYASNLHNLKVAAQNDHYKFVKGNITDKALVFDLFARESFDCILHLAAESHVDRSIESPSEFVNTNVSGTQVLLDACRKYDIARYHQISTDEVFGDLPLNRPDLLFNESSPLKPSSPYSASKAAGDLLALAYHRTYGTRVTVSRCSNNYGPYQFPEKLVPRFIYLAMKGKPLTIYGSGENIRDWLHVDDHCSAIDLIAHKGVPGETYNVGGNNERRNIDVAKLILNELGKDESLITYTKDRPGHDLRYAIDATKIKTQLGWSPRYTFEEGIKDTINWYLHNKEWWASLAGIDKL